MAPAFSLSFLLEERVCVHNLLVISSVRIRTSRDIPGSREALHWRTHSRAPLSPVDRIWDVCLLPASASDLEMSRHRFNLSTVTSLQECNQGRAHPQTHLVLYQVATCPLQPKSKSKTEHLKVDPVILKLLPSRSLFLCDSSMPGLDGPAHFMETHEITCTKVKYAHGTVGENYEILTTGQFVCLRGTRRFHSSRCGPVIKTIQNP